MRNYSDKTLEAYRYWIVKFQAFVRSEPPDHLNTKDVKGFLTDLAVRQNVAGATQNQAFNALPFFFEILATNHRSQTARGLRSGKDRRSAHWRRAYQREAIAERSFRTLWDTSVANICAIPANSAIGRGAA